MPVHRVQNYDAVAEQYKCSHTPYYSDSDICMGAVLSVGKSCPETTKGTLYRQREKISAPIRKTHQRFTGVFCRAPRLLLRDAHVRRRPPPVHLAHEREQRLRVPPRPTARGAAARRAITWERGHPRQARKARPTFTRSDASDTDMETTTVPGTASASSLARSAPHSSCAVRNNFLRGKTEAIECGALRN
jgi:hypothetical protein